MNNEQKEFASIYAVTQDDWNSIDATKYFIDNFISETSLNLVIAPAKTGKSLIMQDFIHYLLPKYQNKVFFYIDNDNSLKTAKKRKINEIQYPNFKYINKKKIYEQKGGVNAIFDKLLSYESLQNWVIVFDSLRNFANGVDINKDKDLTPFMEKFETLRIKGACVFLLHHTKKGDNAEFRGGNGIIESVDNVFYLRNLIKESKQQERYKNELYFILELKYSRDENETQKAFYTNTETGEFKEIEIDEAMSKNLPPICIKAHEILKEYGELNQSKLFEMLNITNNAPRRAEIQKGENILYEITQYPNKHKFYSPKY